MEPLSLARRVQAISPSPTLAVDAEVKAMRAKGVDVIGFGAGEPDSDTPLHIREAAARAMNAGETRYTPAAGTVALRQAFAAWHHGSQGVSYDASQVIVTTGGKFALYNLIQCTVDPGDEVVIQAPYWVSYVDMVKCADGKPVLVQTRGTGFKLQPEQLRGALTPRTRLVILNSPSNPSGVCYDARELRALADVVLNHSKALIVSDELYEHMVYGGFEHKATAGLGPEVYARTVLVHGVSKTFAMTGWRIGFCAGPKEIIAAMDKLQSASTSNPTSIAQAGALAAMTGSMEPVREMQRTFARRRDRILKLVRAIPGVTCIEPQGAFYVFPDLSAYLGKRTEGGERIDDTAALCRHLLRTEKVAAVHGSAFGCEGHVRLSYALSDAHIDEGVARMRRGLEALR